MRARGSKVCVLVCARRGLRDEHEAGGGEPRLEAMERLLLCLWELMNWEQGMVSMLSSDGAGVMALHGDDPSACNLCFLARCVDPASVVQSDVHFGADAEAADQLARVQCVAIKLLTSAAAYSAPRPERVILTADNVTPAIFV